MSPNPGTALPRCHLGTAHSLGNVRFRGIFAAWFDSQLPPEESDPAGAAGTPRVGRRSLARSAGQGWAVPVPGRVTIVAQHRSRAGKAPLAAQSSERSSQGLWGFLGVQLWERLLTPCPGPVCALAWLCPGEHTEGGVLENQTFCSF